MKNYEIKNIKKSYADIMRNHQAVKVLEYEKYSEVPRWLKITETAFLIIKRTEELFKSIKATEEKANLVKTIKVNNSLMSIDEFDPSLHKDSEIDKINIRMINKKNKRI